VLSCVFSVVISECYMVKIGCCYHSCFFPCQLWFFALCKNKLLYFLTFLSRLFRYALRLTTLKELTCYYYKTSSPLRLAYNLHMIDAEVMLLLQIILSNLTGCMTPWSLCETWQQCDCELWYVATTG